VVVCAEQRKGIVGRQSGRRWVPTHGTGLALALGDEEGESEARDEYACSM
jgi:hypothetical protein